MRSLLIAAALLIAPEALAQMPASEVQFPELAKSVTDAQIITQLQKDLLDPGSITDLRTCAPSHVKVKDGRLAKWLVYFTVNAKNAYGGYAGRTYYIAIFRAGKPLMLSRIVEAGAEGLNSFIAKSFEKDMVDCHRIPDADIQRILAQ